MCALLRARRESGRTSFLIELDFIASGSPSEMNMRTDQRLPPAHVAAERLEAGLASVRPWVATIWDRRRWLATVNSVTAVLSVAALLLFARPYFDSSVVILPELGRQSGGVLSQLSGFASLSGLGNLSLGRGIPPEVFENLLRSESVLEPVLRNTYRTQATTEPVDLVDYFEIEPDESVAPELRERRRLLEALEVFTGDHLRTSIDRVSGIMTVTVRMPESRLSADVANELARQLDQYVIAQNRRAAGATMEYVASRLTDGRDTLRAAEEELRRFHQQNRSVATSPSLMLEEARLRRDVDLKQAVYLELNRQFEVARVEFLRELPVVTFREPAREPVKKTGPKRTLILVGIMALSVILTTSLVLTGVTVRQLGHAWGQGDATT